MRKAAVILLSGGLDSAVTAATAQRDGFELSALSVDYGQRHRYELEAARRVAERLGIKRHEVVRVDMRAVAASALTSDVPVPKDRGLESMQAGIPVTYVPARNTVFLAIALGFAETLGAADLFLGVNAVDYSGYPDCRGEFIGAFERLANLATKAGVEKTLLFRVHAPLLKLAKADIVRRGIELGAPLEVTHSCYDPGDEGIACGRCDACVLRRQGFADAGLADPIAYAI